VRGHPETDVPATMRDGTVLRADVYQAQDHRRVPVILMRTSMENPLQDRIALPAARCSRRILSGGH